MTKYYNRLTLYSIFPYAILKHKKTERNLRKVTMSGNINFKNLLASRFSHGKHALLKKVILLFLAVLLPLITVSLIYLHHNNLKQQKQALDAIQSNNDSYIARLDENLQQIYTANLHMTEQDLLRDLAVIYPYLSTYDRSIRINLLREQLSSLCSSSPFLETAHAFLFHYNVMYNSDNYHGGSYCTLTEEDTDFYRNLTETHGLVEYYRSPLDGRKTLSVFMAPFSSSPAFAVNFVLSEEALQSYLEANSSYPDEFYLFRMENGFSLSNLPSELCKEAEAFLKQNAHASAPSYQKIELHGKAYTAFLSRMESSGGIYIRLISDTSLLPSIRYSYGLLFLFFFLVICASILFFIGIYRMVHKPLSKLTDAFDEVEHGNFQVQIVQTGNDDFAYLYHAFNNMALKLSHLIERDYNQKLLLQKAEMKQLQAQINPHFLYNSFFMLQRMIRFEPEEASQVANALASCFRYITKNSIDHVTLVEEYAHMKNYVYIQGLRFAGRIQIDLEELPDRFTSLSVPKLILQPILENAFQYGLKNKICDGLIRVRFLSKEQSLRMVIEDNGEELSDELLATLQKKLQDSAHSSAGVEMSGILNIQRRLHIFSKDRDSLEISRSSLGGLCAAITFHMESNASSGFRSTSDIHSPKVGSPEI